MTLQNLPKARLTYQPQQRFALSLQLRTFLSAVFQWTSLVRVRFHYVGVSYNETKDKIEIVSCFNRVKIKDEIEAFINRTENEDQEQQGSFS